MRSLQNKSGRIVAVVVAAIFAFTVLVACFYLFYIPKKYSNAVARASQEYALESELIYAVIRAESNFNQNAVSRSGAVGLMQLMPSTIDFIKKSSSIRVEIDDAEGNIRMGCWYLSYLMKKFGSLTETLAAYNAGEGVVRNWLIQSDCVNEEGELIFIPYPETRRYVAKVKNFYNCYKFFYI